MVNIKLTARVDDNQTDAMPAYASRTVIEIENVDVAYLLQRRLSERVKYLVMAAKVRLPAAPFEDLSLAATESPPCNLLAVIYWQSSWSDGSLS